MAKITIDGLIKRLQKDKQFSKEFKRLSDKCCNDRDNLMEKGTKDRPAVQRFLKSWVEFHKKFALDPVSLAALMGPTKKTYSGSYTCATATGTDAYTVFTGTETWCLYKAGAPTKSKSTAKPTRTSGTTKKSAKKK